MLKLKLGAVVAVALFSSALASAASAQVAPTAGAAREGADRSSRQDVQRMERNLEEGSARNSRGEILTPPEQRASAQAAATKAGLDCQVAEATLRGITETESDLFEIACQGGKGYILIDSTPPQTIDCTLLAAQADRIRAEGGEVPAGSTCTLAGIESDLTGEVAGYAAEAGITCQVDAARLLGTNAEGLLAYEVGCAGTDGFHIERTAQGWNKADCLQLMSQNMECAFTTEAEQVAWFGPLLAANDGGECSVERIRLMAQNDTGRYIEAKCASGDGLVARVKDGAVDGVFTCAAASRVGGGCRMTEVDSGPEE